MSVKIGEYYRVVDRPGLVELLAIGATRRDVVAVATGEFRPPRAFEWYLSGAIVEAYKAPNDLSTPFHIAHLVRKGA